jgi:glycosyltransferase involved in cell wall biosynthesis
LRQETTFEIEVLVGNDCSSDGTKDILDDLAREYPERLIAINRAENVGGHKNSMDVIARARGDFIALCDGDDYWIDKAKLQKQFDALQRNLSIDLCFHSAKEYRNEKFHSVICDYSDKEMIVSLNKVLESGGGFMPTASLMIRKSAIYPFPGWFIEKAPVGDAFFQAQGSINGAIFLPMAASAYRTFSTGSLTSLQLKLKNATCYFQKRAAQFDFCWSSFGDANSISIESIKVEYRRTVAIEALHAGNYEEFKKTLRPVLFNVRGSKKRFFPLLILFFFPKIKKIFSKLNPG